MTATITGHDLPAVLRTALQAGQGNRLLVIRLRFATPRQVRNRRRHRQPIRMLGADIREHDVL